MTKLTTPLDQAHSAMDAAADNVNLRLRFYDLLAQAELFLMLEAEPEGETAKPALFNVEDQTYALVFDTQNRLTSFTENTTPFLAASGSAISQMLAEQGIGLGLNLSVAPSSMLLPPESVDWLRQATKAAPEQEQATPTVLSAPGNLPETIIQALDARLATMAGLARCAYLAQMEFSDRPKTHVMAFVDAAEQAQDAIAQSMSHAIALSGVDAASFGVIFLTSDAPMVPKLDAVALRFDVPERATPPQRAVPGMDPDHPPKLR